MEKTKTTIILNFFFTMYQYMELLQIFNSFQDPRPKTQDVSLTLLLLSFSLLFSFPTRFSFISTNYRILWSIVSYQYKPYSIITHYNYNLKSIRLINCFPSPSSSLLFFFITHYFLLPLRQYLVVDIIVLCNTK